MDKLRKPTIKQKWSTSLRSRHIVDLALSESDQSLRSPGPAQIPSPAIPDRSSAQPSPSSSTSSPQFKRPKTVNVPDFNQPKNQAQADSEWGVSTNVEECTSGTKKLLMELGINKLGEAREILYVIEIEDTEHDIMSQVSNLVAPFLASTIQPASTHQVITFPDVHVSADEDMPSSSRTFRVSSPTEALLDPESGSSYDDSEFSDDDDAEYLVTSAKKEIQQNLSDDEELPPQGTIIACHSGDVMVLAGCKILSMISTFHDNSTYTEQVLARNVRSPYVGRFAIKTPGEVCGRRRNYFLGARSSGLISTSRKQCAGAHRSLSGGRAEAGAPSVGLSHITSDEQTDEPACGRPGIKSVPRPFPLPRPALYRTPAPSAVSPPCAVKADNNNYHAIPTNTNKELCLFACSFGFDGSTGKLNGRDLSKTTQESVTEAPAALPAVAGLYLYRIDR
ncbi:hypothetical protein EVAR_85489_1 [Eumeta japonica]|uniref:Uncharacterized protein n=1 Tax=Eumeta variegata TaxID=151549 RepID=A0A4C1VD83_EUMVA|nr:hypothetical protein EVAR_85489_1 [Eumeta japonica]